MTEFERLYREKYEYILRYLVKLSQDTFLAEELTQETFYRAYINFAGLREKDKAVVWLCQIAKNTYYAWYNENKKIKSLDEVLDRNGKESEKATGNTDLESALIQREISENAIECLHRLEEPYKEVVMLVVFGGLTLKDISAIFGKSESWARVTFYRAKQKLLEMMR